MDTTYCQAITAYGMKSRALVPQEQNPRLPSVVARVQSNFVFADVIVASALHKRAGIAGCSSSEEDFGRVVGIIWAFANLAVLSPLTIQVVVSGRMTWKDGQSRTCPDISSTIRGRKAARLDELQRSPAATTGYLA